jgi:hypothetical protein
MPDYSSQISGLEAKIAELQEQLAARQAATPMPDPVMDVAEPRVGTMGGPGFGEFPLGTAGPRIDPSDPAFVPPPMIGGMGPGNIQIPNIDVDAIRERIANLNIDIGGEGGRPDMPVSIPVVPKGRPVVSLPPQDVGGRKKLTKGPGMPKKIPMNRHQSKELKPPSIERIMPPMPEEIAAPTAPKKGFFGKIQEAIEARRDPMEGFIPFVPPQINEPMPMLQLCLLQLCLLQPAPVMPAPVMPAPMPMPSLPQFPMPQIDPMGRVAAPLTRGPVNTAINRPAVGMRGPGMRMR